MSSSAPPADSSSAPIDPERVRRLFSDPARSLESEFLRREIAARMHERLALVKIEPAAVLDAGCGNGPDLALLQQRFPVARLLGADVSAPMLAAARDRLDGARSSLDRLLAKWLPGKGSSASGMDLLCVDFARLPLAANSLDLIWSNLALHWHPQPDRVFQEWRRLLRVDGLLMFSCFGPDTFRELREAFAGLRAERRLLPFVDMHDFGDMLVQAGFSTPVMDMEKLTVTYSSVEKMLADVRAFGGNPLATRERGLLGRQAGGRVLQALEHKRDAAGRLSLTFEVIYGHAFRPAPRATAAGETIVRFDRPKR